MTWPSGFELLAHMRPHIRISPFLPREWDSLLQEKDKNSKYSSIENPSFWLDQAKDLKFYDSGRNALFACLHHENLKTDDEVLILTTTGGPYISSCVTQTIEKICLWKRKPSAKTRAVLVIHEFGFPCPSSAFEPYIQKGIPVIEDCAYSIGSRMEGAAVGKLGDYAIYSLPKYYPVSFGGILVSKKRLKKISVLMLERTDEKLLRQTLKNAAPFCPYWNKIRRAHWKFFAQKLRPYKVTPYFGLDQRVVPGVFLARLPEGFKGDIRKKQLNEAGVEATEYYGQGGFYFPVHQFLTGYEKEYILYHFLKRNRAGRPAPRLEICEGGAPKRLHAKYG